MDTQQPFNDNNFSKPTISGYHPFWENRCTPFLAAILWRFRSHLQEMDVALPGASFHVASKGWANSPNKLNIGRFPDKRNFSKARPQIQWGRKGNEETVVSHKNKAEPQDLVQGFLHSSQAAAPGESLCSIATLELLWQYATSMFELRTWALYLAFLREIWKNPILRNVWNNFELSFGAKRAWTSLWSQSSWGMSSIWGSGERDNLVSLRTAEIEHSPCGDHRVWNNCHWKPIAEKIGHVENLHYGSPVATIIHHHQSFTILSRYSVWLTHCKCVALKTSSTHFRSVDHNGVQQPILSRQQLGI